MKTAEEDQCVSCGEYAGEGRQICLRCEMLIYPKDDSKLDESMMKINKGGWFKNMLKELGGNK